MLARRGMLAGLGSALGGPLIGGCSPLAGTLRTELPPVDPGTPLTIDVHSHVFNGSDLQIASFIKHTRPQQAAFAGLLEQLGNFAPSAVEELRQLDGILPTSVRAMADEQYRKARVRIGEAEARRRLAMPPPPPAMAGARTPEGDLIGQRLAALPERYDNYKNELRARPRARVAGRSGVAPAPAAAAAPGCIEDDADGLFDFLLRNFHYRYVNVHDYLEEYSLRPTRKVDLMVTQIVDYDWPLGELRTDSPLRDQIRLMERISRLTAGRVLNFAPFCPFKQVAFNRGIGNVDDPMDLVQDAILKRGHIGVKIYPPMGFLPYGNERLGPTYWNGTPVRGELLGRALGADLDRALDGLYRWCLANDVPVMAHTSPSNVAAPKYLADLMVPQSWQPVLKAYPGLRVNFAHFGHTDVVCNAGANAGLLMGLMTPGADSPGGRLYADSGYFAEILGDKQKVETQFRSLLLQTAGKGDAALGRRLMYGTDWEMVIIEGGTSAYLELFESVLDDLARDSAVNPDKELTERFFGLNAATYLGLRRGDYNRARLDKFFGSARPHWMAKVDKAFPAPVGL